MIQIQVRPESNQQTLFSYASTVVPRIGDLIALTIDDQGYLTAEVIDVLHVPLARPKTVQIERRDISVDSAAVVVIDDASDFDVAAFVAQRQRAREKKE